MGVLLLALACAPSPEPVDTGAPPVDIPGHNECLPLGEEMTEDVCLAVVEDFGHYPTTSENKSGDEPRPDDPRAEDPELAWITSEVKRCACSCCHTARWGGAGVYFWDLDWAPVWTDSASLWSLSVFGGYTEDYDQTLPTAEIERVRAWLELEAERRRAAP